MATDTSDLYCEESDLYAAGLQRGSIPNPARELSRVDPAADRLVLAMHGFADGDRVTFRADAGGRLCEPLAADTEYFVASLGLDTFQVRASESGDPIDLVTEGFRVLVIASLQGKLDAARAYGSRLIDSMLPAGAVPLETPYPELVVLTAAELAVGKLLAGTGGQKSLADMVDTANKRLAYWAKNVPLRGKNAPKPTAVAQAAAAPFGDVNGWRRFGGL